MRLEPGTRVSRTVEDQTVHGTVLLGGPMYTVAEDDRPGLYCWPVGDTQKEES